MMQDDKHEATPSMQSAQSEAGDRGTRMQVDHDELIPMWMYDWKRGRLRLVGKAYVIARLFVRWVRRERG